MNFVLIHRIPGRARLRSRQSFGRRTATALADALEALEGVEGVRVNPRTGSVLLLYGEEAALERACLFLNGARCEAEKPVPAPSCREQGRPGLFPFFRYLFASTINQGAHMLSVCALRTELRRR